MGLSWCNPRTVRRINREFGTDFLWCSTHQSGRVLGTRPGGNQWWLDRRSGGMQRAAIRSTLSYEVFGDNIPPL
jgi:hypothetical protein